MLDVKLGREGPPPVDAATILCVRENEGALEVLCVERHRQSKFLGGAIVFPGGKLDASDRDPRLLPRGVDETRGALLVAAARECFEEAGLLFHRGPTVDDVTRRTLRDRLAKGERLADLLESAGLTLDLEAFVPFARWVTPKVENRRFDTRFYLAAAPHGQDAVHDAHETTSAFWGTPRAVLDRFERGEVALFPPTHRSLELLEGARTVADAMAVARVQSLDEICPELVKQASGEGETLALVLPGDPEHSLREPRVAGRSRYVLRGEQWLPV